jgi:serine protease Do
MTRWSAALAFLILGAFAGTFLVRPLLLGQAQADKETAAIPKEMTSYRDVVKRVLPAVVSIEATTKPKVRPAKKDAKPRRSPALDPRIPEEFRKFFEDFQGRGFDFEEQEQVPSHGFGSGFIVDPKGVILTNYHVVGGADRVEVQLMDGSRYASQSVAGDRKTDLAIVRIDTQGKSLPYLELGDSEAMQIGDRVLAVGAPFGLRGTVTAGIVSAKGRNGLRMNMYEDFIQTDAAINPGNSGGPLVNLAGQVIGIDAAIKTRTGGFQGVGLAVASNLAKSVMKSLQKDGKVHRGYLGVQIKDLTPEVAEQLGLSHNTGVVVARVYKGSPAANAGLKSGDIITAVNGKEVKEGRVLQTIVSGLPLHKPVPLAVVRDGQPRTMHVTIEEQPEQYGLEQEPVRQRAPADKESVSLNDLGLELSDLTGDTAKELGYDGQAKGAVVTRVDPNGPAFEAGLRKGTLIQRVNKKPVASAEGVKRALKKAHLDKGVLLQVQTPQGGTDYLVLKVEKAKK